MAHEYIRSKPYEKWSMKIKFPEGGEESSASQRSRERRTKKSESGELGPKEQVDSHENPDLAEANRQVFFKHGKPAGALPSGSRPHGGRTPAALGGAQKPATAGAIGAAPSRREPVAALPAGSRPHEGPAAPSLGGSLHRGAAEIGGGTLTSEQHFEQFPARYNIPGLSDLVRQTMDQRSRQAGGHTGETGEIVGWATGYGPDAKKPQVDDRSIWTGEIVGENPKDYEKGHTGEIRAIGTTPEKAATQPVPTVSPRQFDATQPQPRIGDTSTLHPVRAHGGREAPPLSGSRAPAAPLSGSRREAPALGGGLSSTPPRLAISAAPSLNLPTMTPGEVGEALSFGQAVQNHRQFAGTDTGSLDIQRKYR